MALTPAQLDKLPDSMIQLMSELQDEIISDVCRRIKKTNLLTPTAEWQLVKANQLTLSSQEVKRRIAQKLKISERSVKELYTDAVRTAIREDEKIYKFAMADGILSGDYREKLTNYTRSVAFSNALKKGLKNTNGLMRNLTNSAAAAANRQLSDALDLAYLEVASGAFTTQEAVFKAVKKLGADGIKCVSYKSGRTDQLDVAVRRAIVTGIGKTCGDMQLGLAHEMDCQLVEVSSHLGARPSHAEWQGQIYSLVKGHPKYPYFYDATGYGTGDGLCGWNCRHSFFPYFDGLSRPANEPNFSRAENAQVYADTQKQRGYERAIRKSKRELAALDGARSAENDPIAKAKYDSEFARKSAVLKRQEARLPEHLKATGLLPDSSRVRVDGFGRSVSQKAVHANKKYLLDKAEKNDIMKAEQQSDLGLLKQKLRSDDRVSKEYYAAVRGKFSRGSDAAKKAFSKFVPQDSVANAAFEGTACYDTKSQKIYMNYNADMNNPRSNAATWFHEHGHLIDDMAGQLSDDKKFLELLSDDVKHYRESVGKKYNLKTFDNVDKKISSELNDMRKHSAVSDLLNGITNGNIQGCAIHPPRLDGTSYWNDSSITSEAFAHMYEAQFDKVRYKEMIKVFPNSVSYFENKLKEAVK